MEVQVMTKKRTEPLSQSVLLIRNKQHLPNEKKNFQRTYRQMSIDVNRKLCDETKEDKKNSQKPFSRKLAPS